MTRVRVEQIRDGGRLEFGDGSRYPVRRGFAEIPDGKARLLRLAGLGGRANYAATPAPGWACDCGFRAWHWQSCCPKCGGERP